MGETAGQVMLSMESRGAAGKEDGWQRRLWLEVGMETGQGKGDDREGELGEKEDEGKRKNMANGSLQKRAFEGQGSLWHKP